MAVSLLPFSVVQVSSLACSGESALSDFTAHSVHMPEAEVLFWRGCYMLQPYFVPGRGFDQYEPAYELGWQAAIHSRRRVSELGSDFDALELQLRMLWPHRQAASLLDWAQVRGAAHAAWLRAVDARQSAALCPELWGKAEKRRIAHVLRASRQFTRITQIFLDSAQPGMAVDALRRFAQESGRLRHELEALLESGGESVAPLLWMAEQSCNGCSKLGKQAACAQPLHAHGVTSCSAFSSGLSAPSVPLRSRAYQHRFSGFSSTMRWCCGAMHRLCAGWACVVIVMCDRRACQPRVTVTGA